MGNKTREEISNEYKVKKPLYDEFTQKIERLIKELLAERKDLKIHSVSSRSKDIESFDLKLKRKYYSELTEVTDLSGVRIICIFSEDVDKVAEVIKNNFLVNEKYSVDKRKIMDPDRFGYLSLHYVLQLTKKRIEFPEFQRFEGLYCEIQIRSILQHAWAEISHEFGYKSKISIPRQLQRKFAQQAGLLEIADEQFIEIKNEIQEYARNIQSQSWKNLTIDNISVENYLHNSSTIKRIDSKIGVTTNLLQFNTTDSIVSICQYFKIKTIEELENVLLENEEKIVNFFREFWIDHKGSVYRGHSIWFLGYVLAAQTDNEHKIIEYLESMEIERDGPNSDRLEGYDQMRLAEDILEIQKKIS